MKQQIQEKLEQLKQSRANHVAAYNQHDQGLKEATIQIHRHDGAIGELEKLLADEEKPE